MEETISLKEIFDVIKKKFLLILSFTIGAAIISTIISYVFLTPTYESSSQFIVNQSEQDKSTNYNVNDIRSNVELINTYNIIIKSPAILEEVVKELNLSYSVTQLQNKINVLNEENSQVVTVTVTDTNSNLATQIANTTVQIFQTKIPDLMNADNVHILSEAEMKENPSPVSPRPMLNIAIAVVLGGMIGVGSAFLLEYLDNTIMSEEDVEKTLNLPVLGVITHINDGDVQKERFKPTLNRSDRRRLYGSKKG